MKILITGGHLTPALAYIDYLQTVGNEIKIVFVGREYTSSDRSQKSHEKSEIENRKIPFISFDAEKLSNFKLYNFILKLFKFVLSIIAAWGIIYKEKPTIVLSFGGYLAVPIAIAAKISNVPIITHEQTTIPGFANQLISKFANKVVIAHKNTKNGFNKSKTVFIPNFSRKNLWQAQQRPSWFKSKSKKPILYITGGNQGSMLINEVIKNAIPKLVSNWIIIHQTGNPDSKGNTHSSLKKITSKLSSKYKNNYIHFPWVSDNELGWIYQNTSVVISRAGANTLNELEDTNIFSILIPLKIAFQNEQVNNAQSFIKNNPGIIIDQDKIEPSAIVKTLNNLKPKRISKKQIAHKQLENLNRLKKFHNIVRKTCKKS